MTAPESQASGGRIRLRPTAAGWVFLTIALVVSITSVKSQAAMLFVMFGAMIGALAVSAALAWRMLAGVELRRDVPDHAWQNQTVHLGYYLRNVRRRGSCLGVSMAEAGSEGIESVRGFCTHLAAKAFFRAGARFVIRRRGRIRLQGVELRTMFPFGLVSARRVVPLSRSLVVWPARGRLKRTLLRQGAVEASTAAPSQATGGQDEFFGLRDYRSDDNPRWIHWRRSASRTHPVVREMCRPLPDALLVVLDTHLADTSDLCIHRRERIIRFAATLIHHAFSRGYQVGLALAANGGAVVFAPASGLGQQRQLLDALADIDLNTSVTLEDTLAKLHRGLLRDSQVSVLTVDRSRLKPGALGPVRTACREFTLVDDNQLDHLFEDDPLSAAGRR